MRFRTLLRLLSRWKSSLLLLSPSKLAVIAIHSVLGPIQSSGEVPFLPTCSHIGSHIESEVGFMRLQKEKPELLKYLGKQPSAREVQLTLKRTFEQEEWSQADQIRLGGLLVKLLLDTATVPPPEERPHQKRRRGRSVLAEMLPSVKAARERHELSELMPQFIRGGAQRQEAASAGDASAEAGSAATSDDSPSSAAEGGVAAEAELESAFQHTYRYTKNRKVGVIRTSPAVLDMIREGHSVRESGNVRLLPMVVPPKPWQSPDEGGYLVVKSRVMRVRDSRLQWEMLHRRETDLSKVYRALDLLSAVPWRINERVLCVADELWEAGGGVGELPSRTDLPIPEPPADYVESDQEQRRLYYRQLRRLQRLNGDLHSLRCDTTLKLGVARQFRHVDNFYFPHNMDFRGRTYPIPPHLNHLGSDLCRGLLTFSEGKELGADGLGWLKVQLANVFGNNKCSFDDRQRFVDENLPRVLGSAADPISETWWQAAEDPWQALATCYELADALSCPNPERFVSHLPVHMDGSCNGLQHYAALGGDEVGARKVNLLPAAKPDDVYSGVADIVSRLIEEDAMQGVPMALLLRGKVSRKIVKQTVMTSVYGVTLVGARQQIQNALEGADVLDEEQTWKASQYLAGHTLEAVREMFLGARQTMNWLAECAGLIGQTGQPVTWHTPLGLPVVQPYRRPGKYVVNTLMQSVVLQTNHDKLPVNVSRQRSAHPPNYIHSLDSRCCVFCVCVWMCLCAVTSKWCVHLSTTINTIATRF
jgi:DNA-directed RNA polymerase